jgi:hypothetical protein
MHYRSFHPGHDPLPFPVIVCDSRGFIQRRSKVAIEIGNDIPTSGIMRILAKMRSNQKWNGSG